MSPLELLLLLFSLHTSASPLSKRQAQNYTFDGDAPFTIDTETLAASLTCPHGAPTSSSPPVLLVHGTACTGEESWGEGYVPALWANGYTACYVTLPDRAMNDMQVSSEYIAYNLHQISSLSGGLQTAVIAHSQGNPDTQWALQFWPSTRNVTRAFVALSPDFQGIHIAQSNLSVICNDGLCQPSLWQQSAGSQYFNALHGHDFQAQVPTTVVWSHFDEVVIPPLQNAQLPQATIIAVQDLCPARFVDHILMPIDAAGYSLALDALNHGGKASLSRVRPQMLSICLRFNAKNMKVSMVGQLQAAWNEVLHGWIGAPRVSAEPATMAYALANSS